MADYLTLFEAWIPLGKDEFVRDAGVCLQGTFLDRSSNDDYRPAMFIRILCDPLPSPHVAQFTEHVRTPRNVACSVHRRAHAQEWGRVANWIRAQLDPSPSVPLTTESVLERLRAREFHSAMQAKSLAHLGAYVGLFEECCHWTSLYHHMRQQSALPESSVYAVASQQLSDLGTAIRDGKGREFLLAIIRRQRGDLGLPELSER